MKATRITAKQVCFLAIPIALFALLATWSMGLEPDTVRLLLKEGGIVETASAVGYFFCIFFLFYLGRVGSLKSHWYLYVIILCMGLRELDFDKRFTDTGVLQSRFLTSDESLLAKVVGVFVIVLLASALVVWLRRHAKRFVQGLIQLDLPSIICGFILAFVVFTKSMDGLARKLAPLGINVPEDLNELATRFEEVFEFAIPLAIFYAIYLYWRPNRGRLLTNEPRNP